MKHVEPDKWYLAVDSPACGEGIAFAEAPSPDEQPDPIKMRTVTGLVCPRCGHEETYAPALMSRRQGPERKDTA